MATKTKYVAPTANFWSTTLNGAINDSVQTITLNSTTNLQAPGYLVLDREDGSGTATPDSREVIFFTGVSGSDITGVTRGADNSTARSHSDGALVESTVTVGAWNSLVTVVDERIDDNGNLKALVSPVSISILHVETEANVSAASVVGLGISPVWVHVGNFSGPTTLVQTPITMPRAGTWEYFNVITRTVASTSSVAVDVNKNGTSIFDTVGRPSFLPGATFASTASVKTKGFVQGDRFSVDIDLPAAGEDGHVTDVTVIGKAI
jgi:hypothetical protein